MRRLPSPESLFDLFYVDSTSPTGLRYARDRHKCRAGEVAGWSEGRYASVYVDGEQFKAHRVVLAMRSGCDPGLEVDHVDRDSWNNHPFNLRWVDRIGNAGNTRATRSGGVYSNGHSWYYRFSRNKKKYYEGGFVTEHEAHLAKQARLDTLSE